MFDISDSELLMAQMAGKAKQDIHAEWNARYVRDMTEANAKIERLNQRVSDLDNEANAFAAAAAAYSEVLEYFRKQHPNDPMWAKSRHLFKNKTRGSKPRWRAEVYEPALRRKMAEKGVKNAEDFIS